MPEPSGRTTGPARVQMDPDAPGAEEAREHLDLRHRHRSRRLSGLGLPEEEVEASVCGCRLDGLFERGREGEVGSVEADGPSDDRALHPVTQTNGDLPRVAETEDGDREREAAGNAQDVATLGLVLLGELQLTLAAREVRGVRDSRRDIDLSAPATASSAVAGWRARRRG